MNMLMPHVVLFGFTLIAKMSAWYITSYTYLEVDSSLSTGISRATTNTKNDNKTKCRALQAKKCKTKYKTLNYRSAKVVLS